MARRGGQFRGRLCPRAETGIIAPVHELPSHPVEPFWRPGNAHEYDGPEGVIGSDEATAFVTDAAGVVWSIDPTGSLPRRFVNSSVDQLAAFLKTVPARRKAMMGLTDDEAARAVQHLVRELEDVDAVALTDRDAYWSVVIEQLRGGLL